MRKFLTILAAVVALGVIVVLGSQLSAARSQLSDETANTAALQKKLTAAQAEAASAQEAADEANAALTEAQKTAEEALKAAEEAQKIAEEILADAQAAIVAAQAEAASAQAAADEANAALIASQKTVEETRAALTEALQVAAEANAALIEAQAALAAMEDSSIAKPNVDPADPEELAVLNAEGDHLIFTNPEHEYNWPVALVLEDNRACAVTTNAGCDMSVSAFNVTVTAQEGDALAFDCKVSSELAYDFVIVSMNGEETKVASGEKDWTDIVVPFPAAGEYTVTIGYQKDASYDEGQDKAWFANVQLLSGEEAAAALAALPAYPVDEEVTLAVITEGAREIVFDDPEGVIEGGFDDTTFYIIPGDAAEFAVTLTADYTPVAVRVELSSGESFVLADCLHDGAYTFTNRISSEPEQVSLIYDTVDGVPLEILYFGSEDALNDFLALFFAEEDGTVSVSWHYRDADTAD